MKKARSRVDVRDGLKQVGSYPVGWMNCPAITE
ncbi:hypothetical protein Pan44_53860 [Caulifigura coniformis]|uniref:Uncharacterized protein n=1 Tax=Caulifigura coniformis TaxID=2527983 RepID=A0A517SMH6_9PLAN|nr:hypothetical protein Pan44_53860 [Caulifigura coniformis]